MATPSASGRVALGHRLLGMGVALTGGVCQVPTAGVSENETAKWKKRYQAVQLNKETVRAAPAPAPHPWSVSMRSLGSVGVRSPCALRAGSGRVRRHVS